MSQKLINHNNDLKQLRDEGYAIEIIEGYALVHNIPYVNSNREIKVGTLVSTLNLAGDQTIKPETHTIYFIGEYPCNKDGTIITGIQNSSGNIELVKGIIVNHYFSNKPDGGYSNYYDKFIQYIRIISAPAYSLDNTFTPITYNPITTDEDSVFNYYDTNTTRAEIGRITDKLKKHKIGIIGVGGTGSYLLDLVAKTPVAEIHLFDGDEFLQHNAFRIPGAPSVEKLREKSKKVDYLYSIYSNMHKHIIPHGKYITTENIDEILCLDFVFICIDKGKIKKKVVSELIEKKISFIDVGIGIEIFNDMLIGQVRTTTVTDRKIDHLAKRIPFNDDENDNYSTNIQIAELNALNATLAVIKWKKLLGFYQDIGKEYNSIYVINTGVMVNEDKED